MWQAVTPVKHHLLMMKPCYRSLFSVTLQYYKLDIVNILLQFCCMSLTSFEILYEVICRISWSKGNALYAYVNSPRVTKTPYNRFFKGFLLLLCRVLVTLHKNIWVLNPPYTGNSPRVTPYFNSVVL